MMFIVVLLFIVVVVDDLHADSIQLMPRIIREHSPVGHLIVRLNNQSLDTSRSYRFVHANHRELQRYFSLNSSTGELRVIDDLDREVICPHRRIDCQFLLKIFELANETLYHLPLIIEDINDHQPRFPYPSSSIELHLSENSPPFQSKLFLQAAYDQDQLDQQKSLQYQLKHRETTPFPFRLEINDELSDRLALVLIDSLDREQRDSYECTLDVKDTADHHAQLHIRIRIDDVNDHSPIFLHESYSIELTETLPVNSSILQISATDADLGLNGQITYDFSDASKQWSQIFSIDHRTGLLRLRSSLDYEQRSSYLFYVQARDSGPERRSSQTLINITVIDENDCSPSISFRFLPELHSNSNQDQIEIVENYPLEKFFVQILVTDPDSLRVRLWFSQANQSSFHLYLIDQSTYFFNRSKTFDFETEQTIEIVFFAEDIDPRRSLRTNKTLIIRIRDENDHRPEFLQSFYHFSIEENNPINLTVTRLEAFDPDSGDHGRLSYSIVTNDSALPFQIDAQTGLLYALKSFDREQRANYRFEVVAQDFGFPTRLSSNVTIEIRIDDVNDHPPRFEQEQYLFRIAEDYPQWRAVGLVRAEDVDLHTRLFYGLNDDELFTINPQGQLFIRSSSSIDRERQDLYELLVFVSDGVFQRSATVMIQILDINDCRPQWKTPTKNRTVLLINRDINRVGTKIFQFEAIDDDDPNSGNGLVSYTMEDKYHFLHLTTNGGLIFNSTATVGRYLLRIEAKDHGQLIQYSSLIELDLIIGDNQTNASLIASSSSFNTLTTSKRLLLLITVFISLALLLIFLICLMFVLICRYRKEKYFDYVQCHRQPIGGTTMTVVENQFIESNSNSSKLSLDDLHQKRRINHSSSPSYTGTNIYTPHHQISSIIKPTPTTSDYYSNSSKQDEEVDEWIDEQQRSPVHAPTHDWSIEKLLYPDWLYEEARQQKKRHLSTSTFLDIHSSQTIDKRTLSSNSSTSPKQVRFGYSPFNTTIRQLETLTTTTVIANQQTEHTFI